MEETKWLVETKNFHYWAGSGWTADVYRAIQYDTEEEANVQMRKIQVVNPKLCVWVLDHMFM